MKLTAEQINTRTRKQKKYDDVIESVVCGNWTYNRDKVKRWSMKEKMNLLERARKMGRGDDIEKLFKMM